MEEQIKTIESRRKLDAITPANIDRAYDFLYVKTFGKIIDSNYLAYVNALMTEYFNKHKIYDYSVKRIRIGNQKTFMGQIKTRSLFHTNNN